VLEAIRSLRANGNAALAAVYLDEYMREHPRGILVEDALALSIEAASARRDRRSAGDYAERYLRQYPAGRFRALAEDALGRPGQ
jgi:outer membrane protein assembly factor BamD (BamD/ComL family)